MFTKPASNHKRCALVFANGDLNDGLAVRSALALYVEARTAAGTLIVAADGGARHAQALGLTSQLVVGDFDSLTEAELAVLQRAGAELRRSPIHKDETDLELALVAAAEADCDPIIVI